MSGFPLAKEMLFQLDLFGLSGLISYILTSPKSLRCVPFNLKLPAPWLSSELQLFYHRSTCINCKAQKKYIHILRMDAYQYYSKSKLATRTHERNGEHLFSCEFDYPKLQFAECQKVNVWEFCRAATLYDFTIFYSDLWWFFLNDLCELQKRFSAFSDLPGGSHFHQILEPKGNAEMNLSSLGSSPFALLFPGSVTNSVLGRNPSRFLGPR